MGLLRSLVLLDEHLVASDPLGHVAVSIPELDVVVDADHCDLIAAFGDESKDPPAVRRAVERISAAALKAGKSISVYVGNGTEAAWLKTLGASTFVLSSDQGFLRQGALAGLADVRGKIGAAAA